MALDESSRHEELQRLFTRARVLARDQVDEFLASECGDADVRDEVRRLLKHDATPAALATGGALREQFVSSQPHEDAAALDALRRDGFELLRPIGSGGMGIVYEARETALGRSVAVKLLAVAIPSERALARFEREARTLARLKHPGIVAVHAFGVAAGRPYLVMDLVEGVSLRHRMEQEDADAPADIAIDPIVLLGVRLAQALAHAHANGVVHRDIKPSNVIVDASGEPTLIDFGLAREIEGSDLTRSEVLCTPAYSAPEQVRNGAVDGRTDVFGLGAMLLHLLTGTPPWSSETIGELVGEIGKGNPKRALLRNPRLGRALATVLDKAIAVEPSSRYDSMLAFGADLQAVLDRQSIAARPPTAIERATAFFRRKPAWATAYGAVAIAALLALALTVREVQAAETTERVRREAEFRTSLHNGQALLVSDELSDGRSDAGLGGDGTRSAAVQSAVLELKESRVIANRSAALALLRRALELSPDASDARVLLADVLLRTDRVEEALAVLEDSSRPLVRGFAWVHLHDRALGVTRASPPRATSTSIWKDWSAIDRFYLGYETYAQATSAPDQQELLADAYDILSTVASDLPTLRPEVLLGVCLHLSAVQSLADDEEPISRSRARAARAALANYDAFLARVPGAETVAENRLLLVSDAYFAGIDLSDGDRTLFDGLWNELEVRLRTSPDDVTAAGYQARLAALFEQLGDDEKWKAAARSLQRFESEQLRSLDENSIIYAAQALGLACDHLLLMELLDGFDLFGMVLASDPCAGAGPMTQTVRLHQLYIGGQQVAPDPEGLERAIGEFATGTEEDRTRARAIVVELR